jgi:DNA polymerase-3 subunit epsilon
VDMLMAMCEGRKRVAFNTTFDNRIIRIATKRFFPEEIQDAWKAGEYECAMILHKKTVGGKQPKLVDAYRHWTGNELADAHNAMADTLAAMEVYFACKEQADTII